MSSSHSRNGHPESSRAALEAVIDEVVASVGDKPGALMPVLHAVQDRLGHIPPDAVPEIARGLNLSRAEVYGVVTFYHDFRSAPPGRHVLKLCRAEACQSTGGDALAARAEAKIGIALGNTTPDGEITLEPVYCLGLCATAPSAMLDGRVVGRLDERKLD